MKGGLTRTLLLGAVLSLLPAVACATPLRPADPDLFHFQTALESRPLHDLDFVSVDFIYIGIAPPGRETDLAVQRALLRILPGRRPPGRDHRRGELQACVMLGAGLVGLGIVRSRRRRRYPVPERRLAA